jgi:hypothetical protein
MHDLASIRVLPTISRGSFLYEKGFVETGKTKSLIKEASLKKKCTDSFKS